MTETRHARAAPATALLCLWLAACGGGGDGAAVAPSPPPGSPVASATCNLPDFTNAVLSRVNQWRASGANCGSEGSFGPAAPLAWNTLLANAGAAHSQDMAAMNYFSHTGSDGSSPSQRIDAAGYAWSSIGENIAAGQRSVNEVVDGWIASPGHCANIMNPGFVEVGVACVPGTATDAYPTYWTMELARPR